MAREPKQNTSVWLALRNPAFFGLWLPSVVSGVCVSAHDTAATWLMNSLGASALLLALIATAASLPFFVFTLPAGALADLSDRKNLLVAVYLWLAAAAGLLAVCTWLHWVHPYVILTTVFLLGIGFAFNAPIWGSIVPEIVQKEELASAITLGGVQMNLGGILGPALGGLLLPIMGPAMLFSLNALAFLTMAWVISQRYRRRRRPEPYLENFLESFASAVRYVRYTPGIQVILTRNFVFGLFIAAVPALVPVVALQHLRLQASQLGLVFTSMGIGSLLGATLVLPYARAKASPNTLTILAGVILVVVLVLMSIVPNLWMFLPVTALAGISWTVAASELWIAGQRAMPDWARGRMNAVNLMASQGAVALGGVLWGGAATYVGLGPTLVGGALLLTASLTLAIPLSINFASSLNLDPAPLKTTSLMIGDTHEFSFTLEPDDGPVTVTRDLIIRPEDREEFLALVKEYRLIFLRNGAFLFRVAENLEHPGTFRTEMLVSSWAEHLRQFARMTKAETELVERVWAMHAGDEDMVVGHYLPANRLWTPVDFSQFQKTTGRSPYSGNSPKRGYGREAAINPDKR
ncbi:MAG TPA: MFS transporter [Chthoniobacterales bacterium]|nr:MFS transporter [Chthoniobacterales bacterium]